MTFDDWDTYRKKVVLPAGYRHIGPGAWGRRNDDGSLQVFLPFVHYDGKERWRHYADAGLGPDGTRIEEEPHV